MTQRMAAEVSSNQPGLTQGFSSYAIAALRQLRWIPKVLFLPPRLERGRVLQISELVVVGLSNECPSAARGSRGLEDGT